MGFSLNKSREIEVIGHVTDCVRNKTQLNSPNRFGPTFTVSFLNSGLDRLRFPVKGIWKKVVTHKGRRVVKNLQDFTVSTPVGNLLHLESENQLLWDIVRSS